jgi:DNA-binding NarL/FixJ family response regulator
MSVGPTVLVADAQEATRSGVRLNLERGGLVVCAEADTARTALAAASRTVPDVCVIDVQLPGDGIVVAAEISERLPATAVVMLTDSPDPPELFRALGAGARGYLPKSMDPARLSFALKGVLAGEAAIPRLLVARMVEELRGRRRSPAVLEARGIQLTTREWEILELLTDGSSTDQMAYALSISPVTVRRHVSRLLTKLEAPDRAAAVRMVQAEGA